MSTEADFKQKTLLIIDKIYLKTNNKKCIENRFHNLTIMTELLE